jgi:phosphoribosylamine--glycine ligase
MNAAEQDIADGFVTKVKDWRREIGWADVVVFDDVLGNMGAMADEVRAAGKPVIGGSPYSDRLEEDRAFGQQELKAAGVSIIPQENFTSFDDAVAYVQANPTRYVIKPSGEAQNDKRLLFVGEEEDGRDVIGVLHDYQKYQAHRVKEFQLQPSSTARSSSRPSASTSSTRSSSPATSAPPPARWARRCPGASRTACSTPR